MSFVLVATVKLKLHPKIFLQSVNFAANVYFIVDTASDFKRKIIALLDRTFPEYEKLFSDTFGKSSVELLANYTTPEEMLSVDSQTPADLLSKASRGRFGLDKANQIQSKKFSSIPKLVAYAGLYPKSRQSGESKTDGHMSKRGLPYLRRAVWLASTVAAFKNPTLCLFYQKKRSEGKDHLTAIGHVCHKMFAIIFAVLRENKVYVPASTT